jgi:glycosyltransferase involved in cell wall biosynthesis
MKVHNNMDKIPVSVAVICKNEAHNIGRLLESVRDFAEIVVVDSGSTDNTLEIARQYTDKVYSHEWLGDGPQRQIAIGYCQQNWVLNLDADEMVTEALKQEMIEAIKDSRFKAYRVKFNDYFMSGFHSGGSKMNAKVRMFRRDSVVFQQKIVHASAPDVVGRTGQLKNPVMHYGDMTIENKLKKNNIYSSLMVKEKLFQHKRPNIFKLFFIFPAAFIKSYVLRRNFLNGRRGFIGSMINAFYAFLKEAKLYEHHLALSEKPIDCNRTEK